MSSQKKYYKDLDFLRFLFCIAVLFYHLNLLKGGFLAVCSFFVLSGYLSCFSLFKKEKFSFLDYYKNRIKKLYIPLLFVVFMTIAVVSFLPNGLWIHLKQETFSVLLGYNNFWQLNAHFDYFTRTVDSPFTHLWYISILLQFDLLFPFLFLFFKKMGDFFSKYVPCVLSVLLTVVFSIFFFHCAFKQNIMVAYYNTFARLFSLFFGVTLGLIHFYFGNVIPRFFKENKRNRFVFFFYVVLLILFFVFLSSSSSYFALSMLLVSFITMRLIDYGTCLSSREIPVLDKLIKYFSSISYEIYLVQYPVIYGFSQLVIPYYVRIGGILLFVVVLAMGIYFGLNKTNRGKVFRSCVFVACFAISFYGCYRFVKAEDYSKEMKELEVQLENNEALMKERQKEYEEKMQQEKEAWQVQLNELATNEENLYQLVSELPISGVGDSVMLGALTRLYDEFSNGYFDAKISRTAWVANGILTDMKAKGLLGDVVILNLGANGDCPLDCKTKIMKTLEKKEVFWLTVTNDSDVHINAKLKEFATHYDNLHIVDWEAISRGHQEYFIADGIHLTEKGATEYAKAIHHSIYEVYLQKYTEQKEQIIKDYEMERKNRITFYGNDVLINLYESIRDTFEEDSFATDKSYTYAKIKEDIEFSLQEDTLTNKIVFLLDKSASLTIEDYSKLVSLCDGREIYIVSISDDLSRLEDDHIHVLDFYSVLKEHSEYLLVDGVHLTEEGNKALGDMLKASVLSD